MGLFPRVNSQATIEFNVREAVMEVVPSHLPVIIHLCIYLPHFIFGPHQARSLELGSGHCCIHCNFSISFILSMPRDRGKPHRGPAWYTMAARQKQLQKLERALSIARTQRAQLARRDDRERMAWSPPTVFVEEVIPKRPSSSLRRTCSSRCQKIGSLQLASLGMKFGQVQRFTTV
jgi:hypothetical protein